MARRRTAIWAALAVLAQALASVQAWAQAWDGFRHLPSLFDQPITVTSWNFHQGNDMEEAVREIESTEIYQSTIFCLQELKSDPGWDQAQFLHAEFRQLFPNYTYAASDAIMTKYPIVEKGSLVTDSTGRLISWATLEIQGMRVRVYSIHLVYKVGLNFWANPTRDAEMKVILAHAAQFSGPEIIAGDFNSIGYIPVLGNSWIKAIRDIKKAGFTEATHDTRGATDDIFGQIDWIWVKGLYVESSIHGRDRGSDHHWIQVTLTK